MFATDLNEDCLRCLEIVKRKGVVEGHYVDCHQCRYGVRIANGKRVYAVSQKSVPNKSNNLDNIGVDSNIKKEI